MHTIYSTQSVRTPCWSRALEPSNDSVNKENEPAFIFLSSLIPTLLLPIYSHTRSLSLSFHLWRLLKEFLCLGAHSWGCVKPGLDQKAGSLSVEYRIYYSQFLKTNAESQFIHIYIDTPWSHKVWFFSRVVVMGMKQFYDVFCVLAELYRHEQRSQQVRVERVSPLLVPIISRLCSFSFVK